MNIVRSNVCSNKENINNSLASSGRGQKSSPRKMGAIQQSQVGHGEIFGGKRILSERNTDKESPNKKPCLGQNKDEEVVRRKNLEYLNSLQASPKIPNLYRDPITGFDYIICRIEKYEYKERVLLEKAYCALGARFPEFRLLGMPKGGCVLLSRQMSGKRPSQYLENATEGQKANFYQEVCKVFAADVLFGNIRVLRGSLDDFYVIDEQGVVWRSAATMLNASEISAAYPVEIWDARDSDKNVHGSVIWNRLNILEIANQITKLVKTEDAFFYGFLEKEKKIANKRLANLLIVANKTLSMWKDGWSIGYIDSINKHMVCLKEAGCEDRLPVWLRPEGVTACKLIGPSGHRFEGLRGEHSVVERVLMPYVKENKGNYQFIIDWMVGHESSGWSGMSQVLMYFLRLHRVAPSCGYFWQQGELMAKLYYDECAEREGDGDKVKGSKIIENSFIILHAFTQIILGYVDFPNNNRRTREGEGVVKFLRSESKHVMFDYSRTFANNIDMRMAPYSSGSVVSNPPLVHGTEVTERIIPHHRVIALYFMMRSLAEKYRGAFSNDFQNEFTAILGGINCNYIGTLSKN